MRGEADEPSAWYFGGEAGGWSRFKRGRRGEERPLTATASRYAQWSHEPHRWRLLEGFRTFFGSRSRKTQVKTRHTTSSSLSLNTDVGCLPSKKCHISLIPPPPCSAPSCLFKGDLVPAALTESPCWRELCLATLTGVWSRTPRSWRPWRLLRYAPGAGGRRHAQLSPLGTGHAREAVAHIQVTTPPLPHPLSLPAGDMNCG